MNPKVAAGRKTELHLQVAPRPQLLDLDDISLVYNTKTGPLAALSNLHFGVAEEEFVSVLGPSGCGKSTLLKILSGLVLPTSGEARLSGTPITKPSGDVGVIFQNPNLMPWRTVLSNVLICAEALHMDARVARQRAAELLGMVGLKGFEGNYPRELSGGMQQRVALVRGLVHDPKILLMDEPFSALDAMTRERMGIELQQLWLETRKSVVFITHSIPEAAFLSDRVVVLSGRPGRAIADIDVAIPRPRTLDTMNDPRFLDICSQLRGYFTQEFDGTKK